MTIVCNSGLQITGVTTILPPVTGAFTPASTSTWYRIGNLPTVSGYGQYSEVFLKYNGSTGIHYLKITLSRVADDGVYDTFVKVETLGRYTAGHGITSVRVFDAEGSAPVYVDVLFDDTTAINSITTDVISVDSFSGHAFIPDSNFTSQGTTATGSYTIICNCGTLDFIQGTTRIGVTREIDTNANEFIKGGGYLNYYNAGATTAPASSNGCFQYCTISANINIAPTGFSAGNVLYLIVKNTSPTTSTITFGTGVTVGLISGGTVLFHAIYTGTTWFAGVVNSNQMSYNYP